MSRFKETGGNRWANVIESVSTRGAEEGVLEPGSTVCEGGGVVQLEKS